MSVGSIGQATNAVTGVGKRAPVLEGQEIRRGPHEVSAPVSGVKTPGADIVAEDRAARAAQTLRDRDVGLGAHLDQMV